MYKFSNGVMLDKDDVVMKDKDTKILIVEETYTTYLRVHTDYVLTQKSDDEIRSLLTGTMPEEGHDQREELLKITDPFSDGEKIKFNKEDI